MLANADFISGWRPGQTNDEYHADQTAKSRSQIITAIEESPALFHEKCVRGMHSTPPTSAMKLGTLTHHAILEGEDFFKRYAVMPEWWDHEKNQPLNKNTNLYKEKRKAWLEEDAAGCLVVSQKELDTIRGQIESIAEHDDARLILTGGVAEQSGYFADPETNLALRFRFDYYNESLGVLADLKTTTSCREDEFSKSIWNFRYDFQMAMYCEGIYEITGVRPDLPVYIAVENTAPYDVAVYALDAEAMAIGLRDYRRATKLIRACFDSNQWPRYQSKMKSISVPYWAKKELA